MSGSHHHSRHILADDLDPEPWCPEDTELSCSDSMVHEGTPDTSGLIRAHGIVAGEDSGKGRRVAIYRRGDGRCVGVASVTLGEDSTLAARTGATRGALARCAFAGDVLVDPQMEAEIVPALLYLCCRRARLFERPVLLTAVAGKPKSPVLCDLDLLPHLPSIASDGGVYSPAAQRLDVLSQKAFAAVSERVGALLRGQFVAETVETLDIWIERFFRTSWFTSIREGTMTKEQYIYTLSNLHQFVRWTTRLIGLAVRHCRDRELRNKWLSHLSGELNHEILIEKDLAALGADVDYVVHTMVPTVANQQFMVTQESMIAFHEDPVLFMAAPFVAEGFASRLDQGFIDALRQVVGSWGVEDPRRATVFLASHVEYDGGDDGHWEQTRRVLGRYLRTESDIQRFLNVMRLSMGAFERSYASYVEDLAIFQAPPRG